MDSLTREETINRHFPFVQSIAKIVRQKAALPADLDDDLTSVGVIALIEQLDRWDPEQGDLKCFAAFRVKGAMLDWLNKNHTADRLEELPEPVDTRPSLDKVIDIGERRARLKEAVTQLEPRRRKVIQMRLANRDETDIAQALRVSQPRVSELYHSGIVLMRPYVTGIDDVLAA